MPRPTPLWSRANSDAVRHQLVWQCGALCDVFLGKHSPVLKDEAFACQPMHVGRLYGVVIARVSVRSLVVGNLDSKHVVVVVHAVGGNAWPEVW
jgi:hypothetical protein